MADIKETREVVQAVLATVRESFKLAADGVQITDAIKLASNQELIGLSVQAFQGREKVGEELRDLDEQEAEEIAAMVMTGVAETLVAAGFKPSNKVLRYLNIAPKVLELAKHNYVEGKEIFEAINAPEA